MSLEAPVYLVDTAGPWGDRFLLTAEAIVVCHYNGKVRASFAIEDLSVSDKAAICAVLMGLET